MSDPALFISSAANTADLAIQQPIELLRFKRNEDGDIVIVINHEATLEQFVELFFGGVRS